MKGKRRAKRTGIFGYFTQNTKEIQREMKENGARSAPGNLLDISFKYKGNTKEMKGKRRARRAGGF